MAMIKTINRWTIEGHNYLLENKEGETFNQFTFTDDLIADSWLYIKTTGLCTGNLLRPLDWKCQFLCVIFNHPCWHFRLCGALANHYIWVSSSNTTGGVAVSKIFDIVLVKEPVRIKFLENAFLWMCSFWQGALFMVSVLFSLSWCYRLPCDGL